MELSNGNSFARFIMTLFIFLCLIGLAPMLYSGVVFMKENLSCSTDYIFLCFVGDALLPILVVVVLTMLIAYFTGGR
jgi:hypothetical protein